MPDRRWVKELLERERDQFVKTHPRSGELHSSASRSLLSGVPMNWMTRWAGPFPVFLREAQGSRVVDVDGNEYVDLCLGDTGAMTGHSPAPTVAAITDQARRGITTMLPTEAALSVGETLERRFGLHHWQFTVSATDANRFTIREARHVTGRPKILVFNHCYHGSVDETFATLTDQGVVPRYGNVGPPVDVALTTRVAEFNDVDRLARELAHGDVACVLTEPALTNIGIVLPDPDFHEHLRRLTRDAGTWLVIDETHTLCCGPGGYTGAYGLEPDALTVGKPIAGGIPTGAYGFTDEIAEQVIERSFREAADVGGVGGTLAGNALSLAAVEATLNEVLTEEAFVRMIALAERYERGVSRVLEQTSMQWSVTRLGCRVEYMFAPTLPHTGAEAADAMDTDLDAFMHLYMLNRGILLTPFHMMALMSPATSEADVDAHTKAFEQATGELLGSASP